MRGALRQRRTGNPDMALLAVTGALLVIGLQVVYSASFALALRSYGEATHFVLRQLAWAAAGLAVMGALALVDYRRLRPWALPALLLTIAGLAAVQWEGLAVTQYGATRRLALGFLPAIQPSEFAKLALVFYISAWLAARGSEVRSLGYGLLPFGIAVGIVTYLVVGQPDLGTTAVIAATTIALFFVGGGNLLHIIILVVGAGAAVWQMVVVRGYNWARIRDFLNPWPQADTSAYQIVQQLIALGSGGLTGLGIGASRQKFFYIPAAHTDGVFAIIGEEAGFIGCLLVIGLFALLAFRGFAISLAATDTFGRLLAFGITFSIIIQALVNVGGVTKAIPMTGIPLPFISYGGSSLLTTLAGVGLLLSVSRYGRGSEENQGRARPAIKANRD